MVDAFANNFAQGDVGASFAVVQHGELVVDIWGGHQDVERTLPWQENTIVNVYSSTKTMTFLAALLLADRGQLDLHAPVAKYWPEFAANGKAQVKVSHLLAHSVGIYIGCRIIYRIRIGRTISCAKTYFFLAFKFPCGNSLNKFLLQQPQSIWRYNFT